MSAQAHLVLVDYYLWDTLGNPSSEAAQIESTLGLTAGSLTYLNKFDYGSGYDDKGAVDYDSSIPNFSVSPDSGDTATATVGWDLTDSGYFASYVLVKDGKEGGPDGLTYYSLWRVTDDQKWVSNGDPVDLEVDANSGATKDISHISWFGGAGSPPPIPTPDGGSTAILLGSALFGISFWARRRA